MQNHITSKKFTNLGYWGIILGGSSGMGRASVYKLADEGMNLSIVYRAKIREDTDFNLEVEDIKNKTGVQITTHNINALKKE